MLSLGYPPCEASKIKLSSEQNISKEVRPSFGSKIQKMEEKTIKKTVKKSAKVAPKEVVSKLRIRVRAYDSKILDASVKQIIDTALRFDVKVLGPIPLPTEIKKYTVNRAAFVYKNAREQFEMRVHKRLIDIISPSAKVVEALTNLSLPSGVNIDVKMI